MKKVCNIFLIVAFIASIASVVYFGVYAIVFQRMQKIDPTQTENIMIGLLWIFTALSIPSIILCSKTRKKLENAFTKKELLITSILLLLAGVIFIGVSIVSFIYVVIPYAALILCVAYLGAGITMLLLKDENLY